MYAEVSWPGEQSLSQDRISGNVRFYQQSPDADVVVTVKIFGLPDGFHGFHVHEKALEDMDGTVFECCDQLGGHFNVGPVWKPDNQSGDKHGIGGHSGDLCNNIYSNSGKSFHLFQDPKISLYSDDPRCVVGRSVVIHEDPDDLGLPEYEDEKKNEDKWITGNAGKRIACGNIIRVHKF